MRSAPSVSYPVGRSRLGVCWLAGLWLAGLAAGLAWLIPGPVDGWRAAVWAAALAGCAVWAWRWGAGQARGRLIWDGSAWHWRGGCGADDGAGSPDADQALTLSVRLDLQRLLLVRCHAPASSSARPRWLWLERGADAAHWLAMRRAVYSPAPHEAAMLAQGRASHP